MTDKILETMDEPVEENVLTEVPSGENAEADKGGKFGNALRKAGKAVGRFFKNIPAYLRAALRTFCGWFGFGVFGGRSSKKRKKIFFDVIGYTLLTIGGITMLYPFWWMFAASLAGPTIGADGVTVTSNALQNMITTIFWPAATSNFGLFYNYQQAITLLNSAWQTVTIGGQAYAFWRSVVNTLLYSLIPVTVGVFTSASAAFAFAKLDFKGKNFVFFYCLAAIMIPFPSIMIAQFCVYSSIGWTDNGLAMIVPGCFGAILTAFFIRQYLYGMPTAILEAARIDGAGYWRQFTSFVIPLAKPSIMAQFILSFMGSWNNYLAPQVFITEDMWKPLTLAIGQLDTSYGTDVTNAPSVMAASVLALLPILILFAIFQKTIIGSIMLTGSKE